MHHLYNSSIMHDIGNAGIVVHVNNRSSHRCIRNSLGILGRLNECTCSMEQEMQSDSCAHMADMFKGEGAGILFSIPWKFLQKKWPRIKEQKHIPWGVGQLFLPRYAPLRAQVLSHLAEELALCGVLLCEVRDVATVKHVVPKAIRTTIPHMVQILVCPLRQAEYTLGEEAWERILYIARRCIEKSVAAYLQRNGHDARQFHVASFSSHTIVYKALVPAVKLGEFYPDLQDSSCAARFVMFHKTMRSNVGTSWRSLQPLRYLSYVGSLPACSSLEQYWQSIEPILKSTRLGSNLSKILPIMNKPTSEAVACDMLCELLVQCGRSLPHVLSMFFTKLLPEHCEYAKAFSAVHNMLMPPLGRRSTVTFSDGFRWLGIVQGGHGASAVRYVLHKDGTLMLATEAGALDLENRYIKAKGQVGLGQMIAVDLLHNTIKGHEQMLKMVVHKNDYKELAQQHLHMLDETIAKAQLLSVAKSDIHTCCHCYGYEKEQWQKNIMNFIQKNILPVSSSPYTLLLSPREYNFFEYFHPIYPLVQGAMPLQRPSLEVFLGPKKNPLEMTYANPYSSSYTWHLDQPLLSPAQWLSLKKNEGKNIHTLDASYGVWQGEFVSQELEEHAKKSLEIRLEKLQQEAVKAIKNGAQYLHISDTIAKEYTFMHKGTLLRLPIPSLLAVSSIHKHLLEQKLRHTCSIIVESGDAYSPWHIFLLCHGGADAVYAHMVMDFLSDFARDEASFMGFVTQYVHSIKEHMQDMVHMLGLSSLPLLQSGTYFMAIGLEKKLIHKHFVNMQWVLGGTTLAEISKNICKRYRQHQHKSARGSNTTTYTHYNETLAHLLHKARQSNSTHAFNAYSNHYESRVAPQSILHMFPLASAPAIHMTNAATEEHSADIMQRIIIKPIAGLKTQAQQCLWQGYALAMQGVEMPFRDAHEQEAVPSIISYSDIFFNPLSLSAISNATEVHICFASSERKMSRWLQKKAHDDTASTSTQQNSKPMLDIFCPRQMRQAIFTLRRVHPRVRIVAILPAGKGIGQWALTLVLAGVHSVHIQGCQNSMSPSSLQHAECHMHHLGMGHMLPWELSIREVQNALTLAGLRRRVRVRVQGAFFTGKDIVKAALLGADEFCLPLPLLVSLGCKLCGTCAENFRYASCPQGLWQEAQHTCVTHTKVHMSSSFTSTDFTGKKEYVRNFIKFLVADTIAQIQQLGFVHFEDVVGRSDLLQFTEESTLIEHCGHLDVRHLAQGPSAFLGYRHGVPSYAPLTPSPLEKALIEKLPNLMRQKKAQHNGTVSLADKAVGTHLSGEIARHFSEQSLSNDAFVIKLWGSAGQSLGAFLAKGITLKLFGEANDHVGKGLRGGIVSVCHSPHVHLEGEGHALIGNGALCGALSGEAYIGGSAGAYFALANQGAHAVVEGVGRCACRYMQAGTVVILGACAHDIAQHMRGGTVYVYKPSRSVQAKGRQFTENVSDADRNFLKYLLQQHAYFTQSAKAEQVLKNWEQEQKEFLLIDS